MEENAQHRVGHTPYGHITAEERKDWLPKAACLQQQIHPKNFFPSNEEDVLDNSTPCWDCEVQLPCLEYALTYPERYGIWGGYGDNERAKLRRWMQKNHRINLNNLEIRNTILKKLSELIVSKKRFTRARPKVKQSS